MGAQGQILEMEPQKEPLVDDSPLNRGPFKTGLGFRDLGFGLLG